MRLSISEILKLVSKHKSTEAKVEELRKHANPTLTTILKYALDPTIKWALPEGAPPYKPNEFPDQHGVLYAETRRLYLFLEGGNPNLSKLRRETLFIQLLENVDPEDAKLLIAAKDKTVPYKNINLKVVTQAFPGLIAEGEEVK